MADYTELAFAFLGGIILGGFYFGGLWLTVCRAPGSANPYRYLAISLILRLLPVLAAFWLMARAHPLYLFCGVLGFFLVRLLAVRHVKQPLLREESNAP